MTGPDAAAKPSDERRPFSFAKLAKRCLHIFVMLGAAGVTALAVLGQFGPAFVQALCSPLSLHVWVCLLIGATLLACLRAWKSLAIVLLAVIAIGVLVVPVVVPRGVAVAPTTSPAIVLKVVGVNTLVGNSPDRAGGRAWLDGLDADVIGVSELSTPWQAAIESTTNADGSPRWPYKLALPEDRNASGMGIYSRHPIVSATPVYSPKGVFPTIDATIDAPGGPIRVLVAHPPPPVNDFLVYARNTEILWLAERCAAQDVPTIVVGDFNETPFGRPIRAFAKRTGYTSARQLVGHAPTWSMALFGVRLPHAVGVTIDHCFVSHHFAPTKFRTGPNVGSDHLPVEVELVRTAK